VKQSCWPCLLLLSLPKDSKSKSLKKTKKQEQKTSLKQQNKKGFIKKRNGCLKRSRSLNQKIKLR
jgi:hypothetical protein